MITVGERGLVNGLGRKTIYLWFTCWFHICKFIPSLIFICNPRSILGAFVVICRHAQSGEKFELPTTSCVFPAQVEQGNALPYFFSSDMVTKCPFHGLFSVILFFLLVTSLFKMSSKYLKCYLMFLSSRRPAKPYEIHVFCSALGRHVLQCCWPLVRC